MVTLIIQLLSIFLFSCLCDEPLCEKQDFTTGYTVHTQTALADEFEVSSEGLAAMLGLLQAYSLIIVIYAISFIWNIYS